MATTFSCSCDPAIPAHGNSTCHCSGCHRSFAGLAAFDRHRVDSRCTAPDPICYAMRALAADIRTFAGLESPALGDSDTQRDHPHTPPTSQETAMTTTPQRFTKRPVTIEAIQWDGTASGDLGVVPSLMAHQARAALVAARKAARHE